MIKLVAQTEEQEWLTVPGVDTIMEEMTREQKGCDNLGTRAGKANCTDRDDGED